MRKAPVAFTSGRSPSLPLKASAVDSAAAAVTLPQARHEHPPTFILSRPEVIVRRGVDSPGSLEHQRIHPGSRPTHRWALDTQPDTPGPSPPAGSLLAAGGGRRRGSGADCRPGPDRRPPPPDPARGAALTPTAHWTTAPGCSVPAHVPAITRSPPSDLQGKSAPRQHNNLPKGCGQC